MPANFEPAAPFSADAYAAFGAGPIIDKQIEFKQQQILANQAHANQAGIAALKANTSLAENYNNNEAARIRQRNQGFTDQRSQQAQFAQQSQMQAEQNDAQARDQINKLATWGNEVSYQDQQEMTRQQAGLQEIQKAVDSNQMTPQEGMEAATYLRSKIDITKQRLQNQQSEKLQQDVQNEQQRYQMNLQNLQTASAIKARGGIDNALPHFDTSTGRMSQLLWDDRKGVYYDPMKGAKGDKATKRFGDEGGQFSYKNALPEAKAEAEAAYPVIKETDTKTGKEFDANAKDRNIYMQDIMKRLISEHERGGIPSQTQQGQPNPQQQGQQQPQPAPKIADNDPSISALRKRGFNDDQIGHYKNVVDGVSELTIKAQQGGLTDKERKDLESLIRHLESYR